MTNSNKKLTTMVLAGLLTAIGIIIPMYSPIKILIEPASFTLASHVPVIIAMFISPMAAAFVALGTTLGFFMAGFPIIVVFRALTHIIFATLGAYILKKNGSILLSYKTAVPFVLFISIIHAIPEVAVSSFFYFSGHSTANFYSLIIGLVGVGTIIHSTVDFIIAAAIWVPLQNVISIPASAKIRLRTAKN